MIRSTAIRLLASAAIALQTASARPDETLRFVLGDAAEASVIELHVRLGETSPTEAWDAAFASLFRFFDRNGDERLDARETSRLPSPFSLRQILWGQFALDSRTDDELVKFAAASPYRLADVAAFYRRRHLGVPIVAQGKTASTAALNDALCRLLDGNKDGRLTQAELLRAPQTAAEWDANGDELLGPGEITAAVSSYPGTNGTVLVTPQNAGDGSVLEYDFGKESTTNVAVAAANRSTLHLRLATMDSPAPPSTWSQHDAEKVIAFVRQEAGRLPEQTQEMRRNAGNWFDKFDRDRNGALDPSESDGPQRAAVERLLSTADRNEDGRLSREEHAAWLDVQSAVAAAQVLVTMIDCRRGLFELLDVDHNGGLSTRELRTAADRVAKFECLPEGRLKTSQLPHTWLVVVSRGHPLSALQMRSHEGPPWFQAMDRNGDGDVSLRESLLPKKAFQRLDRDKDDLMTSLEAQSK